jgi:hypothetical protein
VALRWGVVVAVRMQQAILEKYEYLLPEAFRMI